MQYLRLKGQCLTCGLWTSIFLQITRWADKAAFSFPVQSCSETLPSRRKASCRTASSKQRKINVLSQNHIMYAPATWKRSRSISPTFSCRAWRVFMSLIHTLIWCLYAALISNTAQAHIRAMLHQKCIFAPKQCSFIIARWRKCLRLKGKSVFFLKPWPCIYVFGDDDSPKVSESIQWIASSGGHNMAAIIAT